MNLIRKAFIGMVELETGLKDYQDLAIQKGGWEGPASRKTP